MREGLPRSIMEALCLEVPVIGTDIRGTRDLVTGETGILVKVGDVNALTKAMAWILDHEDRARIMGLKAHEKMADYDTSRIIEGHEALYTQVLAELPKGEPSIRGAR
jgi:glycosyltransferase involved in cell wall biosynthesis